jgi:hypothetical protein
MHIWRLKKKWDYRRITGGTAVIFLIIGLIIGLEDDWLSTVNSVLKVLAYGILVPSMARSPAFFGISLSAGRRLA